MSPISIETERLYLRTLTQADAALAHNYDKNEYQTLEDARKWIRWAHKAGKKERKPFVYFYVWLRQTGQHIGRVYIHKKPELDGEIEIGYGIAEEHRCNGYATEDAQAAVRFAFEQAGQEVLCAIVKPENIASRRVIEKLGFAPRGKRMVLDDDGVTREFDYFKLRKEEWRSLSEK